MGQPAARLTDFHVCPMVTGVVPHVGGPVCAVCEPTVLIGGLPAARISDMLVCVGPPDIIVSGSDTVLIGGLPAARMGDQTAHGGVIVIGDFTVLIGGGAANGADAPSADAPPDADLNPPEEGLSAGPMGTLDNTDPPTPEEGLSAGPMGSLDGTDPSAGEEALSAGPMGTLDDTTPVASDTTLEGQATENAAATGQGEDALQGSASENGPLQGQASENTPLQGYAADSAPLQGYAADTAPLQGRISDTVPNEGGGGPQVPASSMKWYGSVETSEAAAPPAKVILKMPNGWNIEVSAPKSQEEYDAQVRTGFLQGLAHVTSEQRKEDLGKFVKYDWEPNKVVDYAKFTQEVTEIGGEKAVKALEKADKIVEWAKLPGEIHEGQEHVEKWSKWAEEYDEGVASGKYPYSPIVRAYANGQMAGTVVHTYKGLFGG